MRRIIILAALMMAVMLVLSAPMAEARKRHHHRPPAPPAFNVVYCPTGGSTYLCNDTAYNDYLIGREGVRDDIYGEEGNDIYDGKGGNDEWHDSSVTSSDYYLVSVQAFGLLFIQDNGGSFDTLDLSRFYNSSDFSYTKSGDHLFMDGVGTPNDIYIYNFFTVNSIDYFKFLDGTFTAAQIAAKVSD